MPYKISVIGAGLIGRAWAISFARAKNTVKIFDTNSKALSSTLNIIKTSLEDLNTNECLFEQSVSKVFNRISATNDLKEALNETDYVQESCPENLEVKKNVFKALDEMAPNHVILASSSSALVPSLFTSELKGRSRCLVAHPINPPYLIPAVELCPSPWTEEKIMCKAREILEEAGQAPISMSSELDGFIMNRMQGALLQEAFRLIQDGHASVEDIDKGISQGLALRWSFMGPFETIDLNAPGGARDYANRYGEIYARMAEDFAKPINISGSVMDTVEKQRRKILDSTELLSRQAWRDKRLMALAVHKTKSDKSFGK